MAPLVVEKQHLFLTLVAKLITWADANGHLITGGELERTKEQAQLNAQKGSGISNSLHTLCLAIDLKLFVAGVYQTSSDPYRPLGEYWKSLNPLCRWGGDFKDAQGNPKPDGGHFSLEHEGRK